MKFNFTNLKVGSLVEMELVTTQDKIIKLKTIVEEIIDESQIKLFAPISRGTNYPIRLDQKFTLITVFKYPTVDKYDILSCQCKITDKQKEGKISTIEITKTGMFSQIQRRNYFRLPLIKNIDIIHDEKKYELLSKDLSGTGIRGYISQSLPENTEGFLMLDVGNKILELNIKIIECKPDPDHSYRYELRGSFINIRNSQLSSVLKYIFNKQSETIRKQIDLKDYVSILDTEAKYSDFFSMSSIEKTIRATPIVLWALTMIEYVYLLGAFKENNMGLNFFFREFIRTYRPEFLLTANSIAIIIVVFATINLLLNLIYNNKTKLRITINLIVIMVLAFITMFIHYLYI